MPTETLQNLYWLPVLEDDVWKALQTKNYEEAERSLGNVLASIPPNEWDKIFWVALIEGIPVVRGGIEENEWRENMQPILARLVLQIASGEAISKLFRELASFPETASEFEKILILAANSANVEGTNRVKTINRPLYTFLIASPAQEYFSATLPYNMEGIAPSILAQRYLVLPEKLRDEIFSYATAEDIMRITEEQHLSPEKTSAVAVLTGRVLLGFTHPEDIKKEIQKILNLDPRITETLYQALDKKIFSLFREEIHSVYDPIINAQGVAEVDTTPQEKIITFAGLEEETIKKEETLPIHISEKVPAETAKTEESPFILQEEKPIVEPAKPILKKLTSSLGGFFGPKKKEERAPAEAVRAKIEFLGERKEEKEKRVVHYSELRTPLTEITAFSTPAPSEIKTPQPTAEPISVPTPVSSETTSIKKTPWSFKWFGMQSPARDQQKKVPPHEIVGESLAEKEGREESKNAETPKPPETQEGPHVEGNIIDLRK